MKCWDKYQHYKDRDPPWVKLYRDTLTTEAWVLGTDLSRLVQLASTMLAARYSNKIPLNFTLLKKVASFDCSEDQFIVAVDHLVTHEFLEIQEIDDGRLHPASNPIATCATTSEVLYSEQSRAEAEQRRDRAEQIHVEPERSTLVEVKPDPVQLVFDHWRGVHRKPRAQLDAKRRKLIRGALGAYSEADLCQAISGYQNSPHHMGQNDKATVYDSIELMLRDAEHIDAGLRFHAEPPRTDLSEKTRRAVAATADWEPPEMRRAAN